MINRSEMRITMKERLDVLVVERRLADSREKAKAIIMAGNVFVNIRQAPCLTSQAR